MLFVMMLAYGMLYFFKSDQGYNHLKNLSHEVAVAEADLKSVKSQREAIERRVVALRPDSLDLDLLDESARRELGYTAPDEVVLPGH